MTPGNAAADHAPFEQAEERGRQRQVEMLGEHVVHNEQIYSLQAGRQSLGQLVCYVLKLRWDTSLLQGLAHLHDLWMLAIHPGDTNKLCSRG